MSRRLSLITLSLVLVAGLVAVAQAGVGPTLQPSAQQDEDAPPKPVLDEKLHRQLEVEETARFVVEFSARPDLSEADDITDWEERGEFVTTRLRDTADRSQRDARRIVADRGGRAESFWFRNVMVVEGDATLAEELAALPGVTSVRQERVYPLIAPRDGKPIEVAAGDPEWGVAKIGADQVWDLGVLGGGVVIANIDTGVAYTHPALVNQYRGNVGGAFSHDYNWWDPTGTCVDAPCDNVEHGTHTMGTMVGGDGPGPLTPDIGVAPGAQWIAAKGCEDFGCSESALLSSGQWVMAPTDLAGENPDPAKRPDIVNNSWSGPPGDAFYLETVQNWRAAGIVPVFASGNPGPFCGEGGSPGDYLESFSVGATDIDDFIAEFSGRGPSPFGKVNPDVTAPGVDVLSSVPGDGYAAFSGTSMAAPHSAGTLALVLSSAAELFGDIDGATSAVRATALDIVDLECGGEEGGDPNNIYGDGRIDAFAAVQLVATGGTLTGTVTDAGTGAPLGGVRVVANDGNRDYATFTTADGSYQLFLPAGVYGVSATTFGYETAFVSGVTIVTDETTVQDLALTALPTATVTGRVLRAESRRPISGAKVTALGTPVPSVFTDAQGVYSLTLPIGEYVLEATQGGCLTTEQRELSLLADRARFNFHLAQRIDDFGHGCFPIPFDWVDASLPTTVYGDDTTGRLPMPFPFDYYGNEYDQLFIATNGYLTLEDEFLGFSDFFNRPIPDREPPNAAIYAMWQDLWVVDDARVDYEQIEVAGKSALVIEYSGVPQLGSFDGGDFEIKLWEDGAIDLLYGETIGNLGSGGRATIGIEDPSGTDGLQFSFNQPVLDPSSAWRFQVVPTGIVTGTVTNANDGLPVAGATVTAQPSGRTAVTDENGVYSLRLVPGSYALTYSAQNYEPAIRNVRIRPDLVLTVDVALLAAVAEVTPSEIAATVALGEQVETMVTVANTGSATLVWEARERDLGGTPPDLPPAAVTGMVRPAEWEPFEPPPGAGVDLTAEPTFEGPLTPIIEDPIGDAVGSVDVGIISGGADGVEMSMELAFSAETPMGETVGFVLLDTDQDPATGLPPEALSGLPTQDIGFDFFVDLFGAPEGFGLVVDADTFEVVAEIPVVTEGQTYRFDVPLEVLDGDEGSIDVDAVLGDFFEPTDWAPDVGHGTIEPFRDAPWMALSPESGAVAPDGSQEVTVTLGGEGVEPGEYLGQIVFLTNDPRQSIHTVDVALTVELPADFGGLTGTVTNSRAGFPVPATVTVHATQDGAPLDVVTTADDVDGMYELFAPAGTWPVDVELEGYAPFSDEVTIVAGTSTVLDVALDPLWPSATLSGAPIEATLATGETTDAELTLGNIDGLAPLDFEVFELAVGAAAEVTPTHGTNPSPAEAPGTSNEAPEGYEPRSAERAVTAGGPVAVFMDLLPWDSDALLAVLEANGITFDVFTSNDMGTADLSGYEAVYISNDQPDGFYDAYTEHAGRFSDYASAGGYLWFGVAAWGFNDGDADGLVLPGGVTVDGPVFEFANGIAQPDHPVMAGVPDPFTGDAASHATLANVPDGATIAFGVDTGLPTMVEYDVGVGRVLGIAQALEFAWAFGGDGALILENSVPHAYGFEPFTDVPWISVDPTVGTVAEGAEQVLTVSLDATGLAPGVYEVVVAVLTNDPTTPRLDAEVTLTVTG